MNKTLVMIKPDGIRRKLVGTIITAIETRALEITKLQLKQLTRDEAANLYKDHKGKWFFERNIKHVMSGLVLIMEVTGDSACTACREMTMNFRDAYKDIIDLPKNLLHSTEDAEKAEHELNAVGF